MAAPGPPHRPRAGTVGMDGCQPQTHARVYLQVMPMVPYPSAMAEHSRHLIGAEQPCRCVLDKCKPCLGITAVGLWGAWATERGRDGATAAFLWGGRAEGGQRGRDTLCPLPHTSPKPICGLDPCQSHTQNTGNGDLWCPPLAWPHHARTGACRAPPQPPPLPRFRLRMTNFCTAPTAREMKMGEQLGWR